MLTPLVSGPGWARMMKKTVVRQALSGLDVYDGVCILHCLCCIILTVYRGDARSRLELI